MTWLGHRQAEPQPSQKLLPRSFVATKRCFGSEAAVAVAVAVAQSHLTEALRALARSLDRAGAVMVALVVAVVVVQVMVKLAGQTVSWAAAVGPMEIGIVRDWLSHVIRIAAADDTEDRSGKTVMVPDYLIGYHIADFARQTLCFAEKQSSEIPDLELHFGVDFVAAATGSWLH